MFAQRTENWQSDVIENIPKHASRFSSQNSFGPVHCSTENTKLLTLCQIWTRRNLPPGWHWSSSPQVSIPLQNASSRQSESSEQLPSSMQKGAPSMVDKKKELELTNTAVEIFVALFSVVAWTGYIDISRKLKMAREKTERMLVKEHRSIEKLRTNLHPGWHCRFSHVSKPSQKSPLSQCEGSKHSKGHTKQDVAACEQFQTYRHMYYRCGRTSVLTHFQNSDRCFCILREEMRLRVTNAKIKQC